MPRYVDRDAPMVFIYLWFLLFLYPFISLESLVHNGYMYHRRLGKIKLLLVKLFSSIIYFKQKKKKKLFSSILPHLCFFLFTLYLSPILCVPFFYGSFLQGVFVDRSGLFIPFFLFSIVPASN